MYRPDGSEDFRNCETSSPLELGYCGSEGFTVQLVTAAKRPFIDTPSQVPLASTSRPPNMFGASFQECAARDGRA